MRFTTTLLLLCALINLSAAAAAATDSPIDPCTRLKKNPTLESARACLNVFPYDVDRHAAIEKVVRGVAQMYVFGDISRNSPDKNFQPDYDLYASLDKVFAKKDYISDREFQEAISSAFLPLNDAHMVYEPLCYRRLVFYQPFYPVGIIDEKNQTRIMIYGVSDARYEKYLTGEIVKINNKPAAEYLWNWALSGNIGSYKDKMARVNKALARVTLDDENKWNVLPGEFMSRTKIPSDESISYTISMQNSTDLVNLDIPWAVKLPSFGSFNTSKAYWTRHCSMSTKFPLKLNFTEKPNESSNLFDQDDARIFEALPPPKLISLTNSNDNLTDVQKKPNEKAKFASFVVGQTIRDPILSGDKVRFYTLQGNEKVGVLIITSLDSDFADDMRLTIAKAFEYINRNRVTKLIIDLSNNGGGDGCLASEIVATLTPHLWKTFPVVQNQFNKDIKLTPLTLKLCNAALETNMTQWNPRKWIDIRTKEPFKGEEFFTPPRTRRNAGNQTYSQLFQESCPLSLDNPLMNIKHSLKPRDMILLSNGLCGSACGRIFFHLTELDNVKSIVTGAFKNAQRSGAGFPATQVLKYESIVKDIKSLNLSSDADAFGYLPIEAGFRFSARESYSRTKRNLPLEFLFLPADFHYDWNNWTALRPDRVWEEAAKMLGWTSST